MLPTRQRPGWSHTNNRKDGDIEDVELTWHLDITGVNSPGVDAEQAGPDGDRQVRPGIQIAFWIHPLGPDAPKRYETNSDTTVQQVLDKLGLGCDYNLTTTIGLPVKPGLQLH